LGLTGGRRSWVRNGDVLNEAEGKPPTATTAGEGAAEATLLLRGGTPWAHNDVADVLVREGRVAEIAPGIDAPSGEVIDVSGHMLLPGLIDAHCHLDKTLYGGPWTPHSAGDALTDRIANERRRRDELGLPSVDHAAALLERMIAAGTTHVRSHTDIVPDIGLRGVEVVRAAAKRFEDRVTVQQVAFPQGGVLTDRATVDLLGGALEAGMEAIGGIDPAGIDRDPVRHLDVVFGLAERHGVAVDIHLHDGGSLGAWELELVIERAKVTGLGERVTISHAYALSQVDELYQDRLVEGLAEAGMSIVTAAAYSFPVPPVKKLRRAGVNVACGHDGIRDLWGPYGTGDMLERAMLLAYRNTFRRDEDIELALHVATYGGARALGVTSYGLAVGAWADLVAVSAGSAAEAVVTRPARKLVLKGGRLVALEGRIV
jgi:cytosine/adenosine deaminase-related metal-dependent hydrolase